MSLTEIGVKQGELGTKSASCPHRLEKSRSDSDTLPLKRATRGLLTQLSTEKGGGLFVRIGM